MRLLNIAQPAIEAAPANTLDHLWHEATTLGSVRIWQYEHTKSIEAKIVFERRSGTKVEAVGKNTNVAFALAAAINEAREMGAGAAQ